MLPRARPSQRQLAAVAGTAQSQISRIENEPDFPLTRQAVLNIAQGLHQVAPQHFSDAAESLIEGLAGAYAAADPAANAQRSAALRAAAEQSPSADIVLGVDLVTDEIVTGTHLHVAGPRKVHRGGENGGPGFFDKTDNMWAQAAQSARDELRTAVLGIAARYRGVVILSEGNDCAEPAIAHWDSQQKVHRGVDRRFDPIDGITTLVSARERARILIDQLVLPAAVDRAAAQRSTAWIILFANAIGRDRSENCSALTAWSRYRRDPTAPQWTSLHRKFPADQLGEAFATVDTLLAQSEPVLLPWLNADPRADWDISFSSDGPTIRWDITAPDTVDDFAQPSGGDLCLVTEEKAASALTAVLQHKQIPSISIFSKSAPLSVNHCDQVCEFAWAPIGIAGMPFGLLRDAQTMQWRSVQLY